MNRINVDAAIGATSTAVPTSGVRGNECASTRNVVGFELGQRIFAAKHLQVALTHPGVPPAIVFGALAASLVATVGVGLGGLIRHTAGATLALKAAAHGLPITKLALYEPPFIVDDSRPPLGADLAERLVALIAAGRRGDAVELYQSEAIGMPEDLVAQLRHAPFRPGLEAIAHTLAYDATIIGDLTLPTDLAASIQTPTLVLAGENSPPLLRSAARALDDVLPNSKLQILTGQTHDISPEAIAPVLAAFLSS